MAKPKKKTSPRIVPVIPPVVAAVAGVAGRAVAKKAVLTAAQRAAKSKATREQTKNRLKKLDKPLVGKAQRRAVGKTTNKYAQDAIKNQMKNPEFKDMMYANKKSMRPTSWSKTRSITNSPMGALRKGKKPTPYQVSQLNKMKNARKPK